jgi:hypothetical protein
MKKNYLAFILSFTFLSTINLLAQWGINCSQFGGNCSQRSIADVSMANVSNIANGCNTVTLGPGTTMAFTDYTSNPAYQINVVAGQTYTLTVKLNGTLSGKIAAWIDWNQDTMYSGFNNGNNSGAIPEFYQVCAANCTTGTINVTVPLNAHNGNLKMRIRSKTGTAFTKLEGSCDYLVTGETEDYTINVSGGVTHYCLSSSNIVQNNGTLEDNPNMANIGIFKLNTPTGPFQKTSIANSVSLPEYNPNTFGFYSDYRTISPTINLFSSFSYPAKVNYIDYNDTKGDYYARAWIDLNHDGVFQDTTELVFQSNPSTPFIYVGSGVLNPNANILSGLLNIGDYNGVTIDTGIATLRVVLSVAPGFFPPNPNLIKPCNSYPDDTETEDYLVNIQIPPNCNSSPIAGNTLVSKDSVCINDLDTFSLGVSFNQYQAGLTYQWQSANALAGPYTNIAGATNVTYIHTVISTLTKYFRCVVTCTNSGLSSNSTAKKYTVKSHIKCYCLSGGSPIDTSLAGGDGIGRFELGSFSNGNCIAPPVSNTCLTYQTYSGYSNFTNLGPIPLLAPLSYPIKITHVGINNFYFEQRAKVWIDFNHDGAFQGTTELVYDGTTKSPVVQGSSPIPTLNGNVLDSIIYLPSINGTTIQSGITGMRIVLLDPGDSLFYNNSGCGYYQKGGEVEDYLVDIQTAPSCSGTPLGGNTIASDSSVCLNSIVGFSLSGLSPNSGTTYQWQVNGINIPGGTLPFLNTQITSSATYQCVIMCESSNLSSISSPVTISLNPFYDCYCPVNPLFLAPITNIGNVSVNAYLNGNASPIIGNTNLPANSYSNFTNLSPIPVFSGAQNLFKISGTTLISNIAGFPAKIYGKIFIDLNQDAVFDPINELILSDSGNFYNLASNSSIMDSFALISPSAPSGITGMRVILSINKIANSCFGDREIEDYLVDIQPASNCGNLPTVVTALASDTLICANSSVNFTIPNTSLISAGISYQWVYANNVNGPYFFINGANTPILNFDSISTTTYVTCQINCSNSGQQVSIAPIKIDIRPFYECYCYGYYPGLSQAYGGSCDPNVKSVQINTLNNQNSACSINALGNAYMFNSPVGNLTTSIAKGTNYTLTLKLDSTSGLEFLNPLVAYIDFDRDGAFNNSTETIYLFVDSTSWLGGNPPINNFDTVFTVLIPIPTNADTGLTGLRIKTSRQLNGLSQACWITNGEIEDYVIRITEEPCSGAPIVGNTKLNDTTVCIGDSVKMSLPNHVYKPGIIYQWFKNGQLIAGAIDSTYKDIVLGADAYNCALTCVNSSLSTYSNTVTLSINTFYTCYCKAKNSGSPTYLGIGNFAVGAYSNGNPALPVFNNSSIQYYTDYTNLTPIPIAAGANNAFSVSVISSQTGPVFGSNSTKVNVYIDYNHDAVFNPITELAFSDSGNISTNNVLSGVSAIPLNVTYGTTGLRITINRGPCLNNAYTEVEDYLVDIQPAPACASSPLGIIAQSTKTLVCPLDTFSLSLNGLPVLSGYSFQWLSNGTNINGANQTQIFGLSQNANTNYSCVITCTGSASLSTSSTLLINMDTPVNCVCKPTFSNLCNGNAIVSVNLNGIANYTGNSCPPSQPYYTKYTSPIFNTNPGDTTICIFEHDTTVLNFGHFISMWIDYNDDNVFDDSTEIVIANFSLAGNLPIDTNYFIVKVDTGVHALRIIQNSLPLVFNACGNYSQGETEDYLINISDTVSTGIKTRIVGNKGRFNVYPNPSNGVFKFELPNTFNNYNIKVSDLLGRTILEDKNKKQVDLSAFKNGTYTLSIIDEKTRLEKIIILNK